MAGFETKTMSVDGASVQVAVGGAGPAILLLHGFPQTLLTWRAVAPRLAERFSVVCADLPGYGGSSPPPGADTPERQAKRVTAATMVALMRALGHERFAVVGHDRGALVAFRAALDHPDVVTHVGVIDIIPSADLWASLQGAAGVFAFHLYLLAQPTAIAERIVGADPDLFFGYFLDLWTQEPGTIPDDVRAQYLAACRRPETIHAICQDYRATAFVDHAHDADDRDAGRRIRVPTLAIWQDPGNQQLPFDPEAIWRGWAPDLRTLVLPGGHFLPEARPREVADAIRELVS